MRDGGWFLFIENWKSNFLILWNLEKCTNSFWKWKIRCKCGYGNMLFLRKEIDNFLGIFGFLETIFLVSKKLLGKLNFFILDHID